MPGIVDSEPSVGEAAIRHVALGQFEAADGEKPGYDNVTLLAESFAALLDGA